MILLLKVEVAPPPPFFFKLSIEVMVSKTTKHMFVVTVFKNSAASGAFVQHYNIHALVFIVNSWKTMRSHFLPPIVKTEVAQTQ